MNFFITGGTGFVGSALILKLLSNNKHNICAAVRNTRPDFPSNVTQFKFKGISSNNDWSIALEKVDCVIHAAARVHVMSESSANPLKDFRNVNTEGTLNLARQAAKKGVKRFIYISSIKVNGESTKLGVPFTENDKYIPVDYYALSKYEAEQGLLEIAQKTEMEVVIIRPPLVYGPGVKANFYSMMNWLNKGIPLPFGSIKNKRSLVALDNLIDLIIVCVKHPSAANQVFLISDGVDLSTSELLYLVSIKLGKKSRLIPVNQKILEFFLTVLRKKSVAQRLCCSLQVDITKANKLLNWYPPFTVEEELQKTVKHFLEVEV